MFNLSDLIKEENKRNQERLIKDKEYQHNYYYEEKKKRILEGKEEIYIINDDNE